MRSIVKNFEKSKSDNGWFPRVHIDHHDDGVVNNESVGYLDYMAHDGNVLYADIAEIEPDMFEKIQKEKYPYRSVEYDPEEEKIQSLALLGSRPPYFEELGVLRLQAEPVATDSEDDVYFNRRAAVICFQKLSKKDKSMLFGRKYQDDEEDKKPKSEDENGNGDNDTENYEDEDMEYAKFSKMFVRCMKQYEEEKKKSEVKDEAGMEPMTAAYQNMSKKVDLLCKGFKAMQYQKDTSRLDKAINIYCQKTGHSFQSVKSQLSKFSSQEDKENALRLLAVNNSRRYGSSHPSSNFLKNYNNTPSNKTIGKYQGKDLHFAAKVLRDYEVACREDSKFQRIWPDKKGFVDFCVRQEKANPGYYKREFEGVK